VLNRSLPNAKRLEAHRSRGYELSVRVIERAQAEGTLRSDVVAEDLALLFMANAGVVDVTHSAARDAWRRFVAIVLDGMRSEGATSLPAPPTPRQTMRAMRRLARTSHASQRNQ
jgi:hypothetical protein